MRKISEILRGNANLQTAALYGSINKNAAQHAQKAGAQAAKSHAGKGEAGQIKTPPKRI